MRVKSMNCLGKPIPLHVHILYGLCPLNIVRYQSTPVPRQGALVEAGAYVGAGSVVPPGRLIPAGEHWAGNPVVHVVKASAEEISAKREAARGLYEQHMDEFLVYNTIALKQ